MDQPIYRQAYISIAALTCDVSIKAFVNFHTFIGSACRHLHGIKTTLT